MMTLVLSDSDHNTDIIDNVILIWVFSVSDHNSDVINSELVMLLIVC